ncbi:MAG: hypothetical protein R2794_02095 [Chitinophagales bacterium]
MKINLFILFINLFFCHEWLLSQSLKDSILYFEIDSDGSLQIDGQWLESQNGLMTRREFDNTTGLSGNRTLSSYRIRIFDNTSYPLISYKYKYYNFYLDSRKIRKDYFIIDFVIPIYKDIRSKINLNISNVSINDSLDFDSLYLNPVLKDYINFEASSKKANSDWSFIYLKLQKCSIHFQFYNNQISKVVIFPVYDDYK